MGRTALAIIIIGLGSFIFMAGVSAIEQVGKNKVQDSLIRSLVHLERERQETREMAIWCRKLLDYHYENPEFKMGMDFDSLAGINNDYVLRGCHLRDSISSTVSLIYENSKNRK